jgi:hypothetical protein
MSTTLIKKKPLEITVLVCLIMFLLAFIVSTVVLAVQVRKCKNQKVCSKGYINDKEVEQCCSKEQGSPYIDTHQAISGCTSVSK